MNSLIDNRPPRPLMRYPGSKFRLRKWLYKFFVPHKIYVEPFLGTGAMFFYKEPAITEVLNDLNGDVVNVFRVLRNREKSERLARLIELTPYSRQEYELCYEPIDDPVERARRYICRAAFSQRKGPLQKSGFDTRVNGDSYSGRVNYMKDYHHHIHLFTDRLKNAIIEEKDAVKIIQQFDREETLFFVDPEYVGVQKRYPDQFEIEDHKRLRDSLYDREGSIILCGYTCDEYREWYEEEGWIRHDAKAYADGGYKRTESVWLNPKCAQLQHQKDLFKTQNSQTQNLTTQDS